MSKRRRLFVALPIMLLLVFPTGAFVLDTWPQLGAQAASPLRRIFGNQAVAHAETMVFTMQDGVRRLQFQLGLAAPAQPWQPEPATLPQAAPAPVTPTAETVMEPLPTSAAHIDVSTPVSATASTGSVSAGPTATLEPSPTPTPTQLPQWTLPDLAPFTVEAGEGIWQPYIAGGDGEVVALRTYLMPDLDRPYAVVGVVAFDVSRIRLSYMLGTEEPRLPNGPRGSGRIPAADLESGDLLATFNGGFMATHGEYGAMAEGVVALPAKGGYATVAIGPDGLARIGVWGDDIDPAGEYAAWRQNARMIIDDGAINSRVYDGSITTWGGNINGNIVTWRSGLGLSEGGDVLYYLAGPSLSMESLALAMQAAGVHNGLLLDINPTWVHFAAVEAGGEGLLAQPLFEEGMETDPDRYLRPSPRDFFYVMLRE